MKIYRLVVTTVVFICATLGCKEKEMYPFESQQGLNTFGVKIEGNRWLPNQKLGIIVPDKLTGEYHKQGGIVAVTATRDGNDEIIALTIVDVTKPGTHAFNGDSSRSSRTEFWGSNIDDKYRLFPGGINEVNITKLDTINKIVSGNFKIQLKGIKNHIIKDFTDGAFDVKYQSY